MELKIKVFKGAPISVIPSKLDPLKIEMFKQLDKLDADMTIEIESPKSIEVGKFSEQIRRVAAMYCDTKEQERKNKHVPKQGKRISHYRPVYAIRQHKHNNTVTIYCERK